jgi:hypothetical protein
MFLDELPVSLFDGRRIRTGLKPKRGISGNIPGHREPV